MKKLFVLLQWLRHLHVMYSNSSSGKSEVEPNNRYAQAQKMIPFCGGIVVIAI